MGNDSNVEEKQHQAFIHDTTDLDQHACDVLVDHTKLSLLELKLLKYAFDKRCDEKFAYYDEPNKLHESAEDLFTHLFESTIDKEKIGIVGFKEYVSVLSDTMRGKLEDVSKRSSDLFYDEKKKKISKRLMMFVLEKLKKIKGELNNGEDYNNFKEKIDSMFGSKEEFLEIEIFLKMTKKKYYEGIARAFGLFKFYFGTVLKNIEETSQEIQPEMEGELEIQEKSLFSYFGGDNWTKSYFKLFGGLLHEYKSKDSKKPSQIIDILHCRLGENSSTKNEHKFSLTVPESNAIFFRTKDPNLWKKWMNTVLYYNLRVLYNRYNSFAPIHKNVKCFWYINGKPWFQRLADAIMLAKEHIYLTCWFISPQVYLKRDDKKTWKHRFDLMLKKKAEEGVKIYMILWKETKLVQPGLKSGYAKGIFDNLHPNFIIIQHPPVLPVLWGHHQKLLCIDGIAFHGGLDVCWGRWDDENHELADECHYALEWPGKDYFNPLIQGTDDVEHPFKDNLDRMKDPRMPWHDAHVELDGESARDISNNFVERWNTSRHDIINSEINMTTRGKLAKKIPVLKLDTRQISYKISNNLPIVKYNNVSLGKGVSDSQFKKCQVQNLRSLTRWSGTHYTESSVYNAYMDCIRKAKHYIFLENQYFISCSAGSGVKNKIASAILDRLRWAIKGKKKFRVFILLPTTPDGDYKESCHMRCIMYWQLMTLSRGGTSILETLKKEFPKAILSDYIVIFSLRKHGLIGGKPTTEQVYCHSKVLIVDDKKVIIGSANINDRSFLGDRDSELATIIEDESTVDIKMNGKDFKASRYAHELRMFLFKELMGWCDDKYKTQAKGLLDPIHDQTYKKLIKTAVGNTKIYHNVFPYIPSDLITTYQEIRDKKDTFEYVEKNLDQLENIQGIVIMYPLNILSKESLYPTLTDFTSRMLSHNLFQ